MPTVNDFVNMGGWHDDQRKVEEVLSAIKHPLFISAADAIKASGEGKVALLYKYVEKLNGGEFNVRTQEGPQCVSFGAATAVDILKGVEIVLKGEMEDWVAETCSEDIYGGSRVNIGKGQLGSGGGSFGAWAAKYVNELGTLARMKYDEFDLSKYKGSLAEAWGMPGKGVPNSLLKVARQHLVGTVSLVTTYEEVRDALANGYPVTIASSQGFTTTRDREGFAFPSGTWPHQMCLIALDDIGEGCSQKRPGVLVMNSWGKQWISGPKRHNQPDGSFWVDADVLERRILSNRDSWAFSNFDGFKPKKLKLRIL